MKQRLLSILVATLALCGANHVWAQFPDPFFTDETRLNPLYFLYDPPVNSMTPERAEALAVRANTYAMNRVICGHHWKSDIDAGKSLAMVLFAAISGTREYQEQLQKARAEYEKIAYPDGPTGPTSVRQAISEQSKAVGRYYDMLGRRLESLPSHSLYIHKGRKILK